MGGEGWGVHRVEGRGGGVHRVEGNGQTVIPPCRFQ